MRKFILPLLLLISLLAGCAGQPAKNSSSFNAANYDLGSEAGFGEALAASMNAQDATLFSQRMDAQRFAERSLHSLNLGAIKQSTVDSYAEVMGKSLRSRFAQMYAEIESASYVRMLPERAKQPGVSVALIRIAPVAGGINYWEVYLERREGEVRIVDWFSYSLGDLASRSLGRFILQAGMAKLKPDSRQAKLVGDYLRAAQSGDPRKLLAAYDDLPKNFRENSLLMLAQVQASKKISDQAYEATLEKMAPLYRKNDDYALMLVDFYLYASDYDKAHQALDKMAEKIGPDAGLDSLHAGIELNVGNYDRAIVYARDGIKRDSTYEDNYWVLLDALVYSKHFSDAVLVLNILEEGFGYQFDVQKLAELEGYEAFGRSAEFKGWQTASYQ